VLVPFVPIQPPAVGDFPEGRFSSERREFSLFDRFLEDFALVCR